VIQGLRLAEFSYLPVEGIGLQRDQGPDQINPFFLVTL
jgi:hypothetical protein